MASRAAGSEIDSASSDSVTPGEITLTLIPPDCSLRGPSEMAQTANLVAEYTAAVGSTFVRADGCHVDDVPASLRLHDGKRRTDAMQHTADVHIDHPIPFIDLVLGQRRQRHDARVVDHDVHAAVGVGGGGDEPPDVGGVGDIKPAKRRGAAGGLNPRDQRLQPFDAAGTEEESVTVVGQAAVPRLRRFRYWLR